MENSPEESEHWEHERSKITRFILKFAGIASAALAAGGSPLQAEIRLPRLLSDHAVLQRGLPIHVWGWSDEVLFTALIRDWRNHFSQPDLPFIYAQISSFNTDFAGWPLVRDAQRRVLSLKNTAVAITTDVGEPNNIHPADKQTVGARLAMAARAIAYGERIAYEPPLFRQATAIPGGMQVWFDHAAGLTATPGKVDGFEVAGEDHRFQPADASIEGNTVVVRSKTVAAPRYVRYAWTGVAPSALRNDIGLPASTFTSEDLPR